MNIKMTSSNQSICKIALFLSICFNFCGVCISLSTTPTRQFFATTVPGLEKVLYNEIKQISDVTNIEIQSAGVSFQGSDKSGLECLLWLRTSLKLMEKLVENNNIKNKDDLYSLCASIDWCEQIPVTGTIKCDTVLGRDIPKELSHTHFNSLTIKNAIVDQFRDRKNGDRPSVDIYNPDLPILLYLHKGKASLYKVWSGEQSMHKRGYRELMHKAVLRETTAAGILGLTRFDFSTAIANNDFVFMDPMCGSGTLAIEAALMMCNTAPGLLKYTNNVNSGSSSRGRDSRESNRRWEDKERKAESHMKSVPLPVSKWLHSSSTSTSSSTSSSNSHSLSPIEEIWEEVYSHAQSVDLREKTKKFMKTGMKTKIYVNDIHERAIELAIQGSELANVKHLIAFSNNNINDLDLRNSPSQPLLPSLIVTNPPWDKRLEGDHVIDTWKQLSYFAEDNIHDNGGKLWVLSGNSALPGYIEMKPKITIPFSAAGMDVELYGYSIDPIE